MPRRSSLIDIYYDSEGQLLSEQVGKFEPFLRNIALLAPQQREEYAEIQIFLLLLPDSAMRSFLEKKVLPMIEFEGKSLKEWKEITWLGFAKAKHKRKSVDWAGNDGTNPDDGEAEDTEAED